MYKKCLIGVRWDTESPYDKAEWGSVQKGLQVPRLCAVRGAVMIWVAIWLRGRSKLYRFDNCGTEGKR